MERRPTKIRLGSRWFMLALGLAGCGFGSASAVDPMPPQAPVNLPVPPLPNATNGAKPPTEAAFPEFDPAQSTPLPLPKLAEPKDQTPAKVTVFQRPQDDKPATPKAGDDRFAEPPLAPKDPPAAPKTPLPTADPLIADGTRINLPQAPKQRVRFGPRYSKPPSWKLLPNDDTNTQKLLYTGGIIVNVFYTSDAGGKTNDVEFVADEVVAWIKNTKKPAAGGTDLNAPIGGDSNEVEMYLTGNVVIRMYTIDPTGQRNIDQVLRAREIYYEVDKNKAVALNGHLEMNVTGLPEPIQMFGKRIDQLSLNEFHAYQAAVNASKRPSDPGLQYTARESIFTREQKVRTNIFGREYRNLLTGEPDFGYEQLLTSYGVTPRVYDVPFFYLPRQKTDIAEPLGPLSGFSIRNDQILGSQIYLTWDLFKLSGFRGPAGHRWQLFTDYLSLRGTAIGTEYDYVGRDLFDLGQRTGDSSYEQPYSGMVRLYGLQDKRKNRVQFPQRDTDILGGDRGDEPIPPGFRGRFQWKHNQDIYENGTSYLRVMSQVEYLSDKNFLEQYYKYEFDAFPNQESFVYLNGAAGNVGGSLLVQANLERPWITETSWLPKADGFLVGQSFLNLFTYSARASAGYADFQPATVPPLSTTTTDRSLEVGRFSLNQRLDLPFDLGPVRLAPYGVMNLSYYTDDLRNYNGTLSRNQAGRGDQMPTTFPVPLVDPAGDGRGRFYGGGGTQASMTLSKLYADTTSELFNVNGLYHKATLYGNYFVGYSDTPYFQLPQLDRLNDDATDQAYRTSRPRQNTQVRKDPFAAQQLSVSPLYDTQQYAIRRLVDNRIDTLDTLQIVQLGLSQRLQTKRGFPGSQHIVDWMALDLSASAFPEHERDNFGQTWGFLEYRYQWHVGDRMSITSNGWADPIENGARYANFGLNFNRPDGTNFFIRYSHTDPLESRALSGTINYQLNHKYSVNLSTSYDFGLNQSLFNQISIARKGADVTMLFGINVNPLVNNFGIQFALVPNLAGLSGAQLAGSPLFGQR